ncbi:hypothetical protein ACQCSX_04240 [Pseudarthrobacter sp. P1]|uniref:hypothetical protein n=1 Tax=Pseudarthrobacter sp. P1 TaxID=3418418 RepID=UPI003CF91330
MNTHHQPPATLANIPPLAHIQDEIIQALTKARQDLQQARSNTGSRVAIAIAMEERIATARLARDYGMTHARIAEPLAMTGPGVRIMLKRANTTHRNAMEEGSEDGPH